MHSEKIKPAFDKKIALWRELYFLDVGSMIIVARHFRWNDERMKAWFDNSDELEFELGLKPLAITQTDPEMSSSLMKNNTDNECLVCYE